MTTVTIKIGNSDDKLTQSEWNSFVGAVDAAIEKSGAAVHFFGAPPTTAQWQNCAWVIECADTLLQELGETIARIRMRFKQNSVAWTEGKTVFI